MAAAGGLAEVFGLATSAEELRSCKIGGCCGKDTPALFHSEVVVRLQALPEWTLSADRTSISRSLVAKNWKAAMAFLNQISELAEEEGHHPDLHLTSWRNVRLEVSTHAIGGLSLPDFVLAAKIDSIPVECSPKWLREMQASAERDDIPAEVLARFRAVERYIELGNAHDRSGLLAMLATPCDMFGEPATSEGMDWYFDTYQEVAFAVTRPPHLLAKGDPHTVRVCYTRSWLRDGARMQVDVDEFFTFAATTDAISHIGYVRPPTEPVPVADA